ncbi:RagB/SusD family nutrient uptake outer membrane protein [Thalassobellus citreus]|uniref:RagB/SusD family nutrient uptake outer membrane protein n=1 Tax=Thalassobellus citreus TaxID=3367752 RepID=UPI00378AD147
MKTILNKKFGLFFILTIALFLSSCEAEDSFLESDYRGNFTPGIVSDYNLMLNALNLTSQFEGVPLEQMSDNIATTVALVNSENQAYTWQKQLYRPDETPHAWVVSYNKIHIFNTIYNEIDSAVDKDLSSNQDYVKLYKSEALLGRAMEHFFLLNLFSQPYSEANKTKPGIPYIDFADITKQIPPRETIEDTYNKIEADLLSAIPGLPDLNENNTRGSKIGAYGILARVYLFKGEWEKALTYTQLALDIKSDYNLYNEVASLPWRPTDISDAVYYNTNGGNGFLFYSVNISEELNNLYGPTDIRPFLYFIDFFDPTPLYGFQYFYSNKGVTIPELIVTKAELLIRLNRVQEGLDVINDFRNSRDLLGFASPFDTADKEEALNLVLDERRRELCISSLRWFDMRRLDMEGRMNTVTHTDFVTEEVFTLEPGSPRYTLQIPNAIINQEGFEQNP